MPDAVTVYRDKNFSGQSLPLGAGRYNLDVHNIGEDAISSIQVPPGWSITVYSDLDLKGQSASFTADTADLGDFNDRISSLTVQAPVGTDSSIESRSFDSGGIAGIEVGVEGQLIILPPALKA